MDISGGNLGKSDTADHITTVDINFIIIITYREALICGVILVRDSLILCPSLVIFLGAITADVINFIGYCGSNVRTLAKFLHIIIAHEIEKLSDAQYIVHIGVIEGGRFVRGESNTDWATSSQPPGFK